MIIIIKILGVLLLITHSAVIESLVDIDQHVLWVCSEGKMLALLSECLSGLVGEKLVRQCSVSYRWLGRPSLRRDFGDLGRASTLEMELGGPHSGKGSCRACLRSSERTCLARFVVFVQSHGKS